MYEMLYRTLSVRQEPEIIPHPLIRTVLYQLDAIMNF